MEVLANDYEIIQHLSRHVVTKRKKRPSCDVYLSLRSWQADPKIGIAQMGCGISPSAGAQTSSHPWLLSWSLSCFWNPLINPPGRFVPQYAIRKGTRLWCITKCRSQRMQFLRGQQLVLTSQFVNGNIILHTAPSTMRTILNPVQHLAQMHWGN